MDLIVLKQNRQNYQPPDDEIQSYGQYLGLKFPQDNKYKPLLYQALTAPLPADWQACQTNDQQRNLVFRNKKTKKIQQQHPLDQFYREKIHKLKNLDNGLPPIQTIFQERESMLKDSSEMFGAKSRGSKGQSVEYSLNQKNQGIINQISEQKSMYDIQSQQFVQQQQQNTIPRKDPDTLLIIPRQKKTKSPRPRIYKKKRNQPPKLQQIKTQLQNYNYVANFTTKQIMEKNYPEFDSLGEREKLKEVVQISQNLEKRKMELKKVQVQKKKKLEYLEMLKNQLKAIES